MLRASAPILACTLLLTAWVATPPVKSPRVLPLKRSNHLSTTPELPISHQRGRSLTTPLSLWTATDSRRHFNSPIVD